MKIRFVLFVFMVIILVSCSNQPQLNHSIESEKIITLLKENAPSDFGYCNVSEFLSKDFSSQTEGLIECNIFKCNESSNFNEFGVFEFTDIKTAKKGEKVIKQYIEQSKREFENGIIYNTSEYPKFKSAMVKRYDNFIIYTILNKDETEKVYNIISNYIVSDVK